MDSMQTLVVALLVPGCMLYAAWKLMPSVARRALATAALRLPHLPRLIETRLMKSAQAASGCGCDGCDHAAKKPAASASAEKAPPSQPITFHARPRR